MKKTKQKKRTKNGNSNVLKFAKAECDVSIFTNLKLSFLVVVFFSCFNSYFVEFAVVYFWFS